MKCRAAKQRPGKQASEGFILVAVLWLLAALATFASIYATYVIDTAAAFRTYDDRLREEALVSGAVELVVYGLTSKAERHPTHGQFSFRLGQADVAVEFRSEASRIDLNAAPKELLVGLLAALGARRSRCAKDTLIGSSLGEPLRFRAKMQRLRPTRHATAICATRSAVP